MTQLFNLKALRLIVVGGAKALTNGEVGNQEFEDEIRLYNP